MIIKKYKNKHGNIQLTYVDGRLFSISAKSSCNQKDWAYWRDLVPYYPPGNLTDIENWQEIPVPAVNEKIGLFCLVYKQRMGTAYKPTKAECSRLKTEGTPVTRELLAIFLDKSRWWGKTLTISSYIARYNDLVLLAKQAGKPAFPDRYDRDFEKKLAAGALPLYWQHLRKLGLKPVKAKNGDIIDWK